MPASVSPQLDVPDPIVLPRWCRWLTVLWGLFIAFTVGVWLVSRFAGERYWLATLILFAPQCLLLIPWAILTLLTVLLRQRLLGAAFASLALILWPLLHVAVHISTALAPTPPAAHSRDTLRVLTLNTHFESLHVDALRQYIMNVDPDVIALQEWDRPHHHAVFDHTAWHLIQNDDACLASRYPIRLLTGPDVSLGPAGGGAYTYEIQTPAGPAPFFNVHLESPHLAFRQALHMNPAGKDAIDNNALGRATQSAELNREAARLGRCVILAGDFNLPPESIFYRRHLSQYTDAFAAAGFGIGLTYRSPTTATRIDHILTGRGWICERCWVGPDVGSQHRPVIADLRRRS